MKVRLIDTRKFYEFDTSRQNVVEEFRRLGYDQNGIVWPTEKFAKSYPEFSEMPRFNGLFGPIGDTGGGARYETKAAFDLLTMD